MTRTRYHVKINNPCDKDWSTMTDEGLDKFCSCCATTILDFTQLSDTEIIDKISSAHGRVCARMSTSQVKREFIYRKKINTKSWIRKLLSGLLLFGITDHLKANEVGSRETIAETPILDPFDALQMQSPPALPVNDSLQYTISGIVVEAVKGRPLPFVTVRSEDNRIRTTTDKDGNFHLNVSKAHAAEKIKLFFISIGYVAESILVTETDLPLRNKVVMMEPDQVELGEVVFTKEMLKKYKKKRRWLF